MINNFYFFTATVLEWKHILKSDKYKDILIESFKYHVEKKLLRIFAFVIMPNHFHSVWKINETLERSDFQRNILKFTGQTILRDLKLIAEKFTNQCTLEQKTGSISSGKGIHYQCHCTHRK